MIRAVNAAAFGGSEQADLVDKLRDDHALISLVAELRPRIVGHILFSRMWIKTPAGSVSAVALAPVAVHPDYKRQGIGSRLIQRGLHLLRDRGEKFVIVVGHPLALAWCCPDETSEYADGVLVALEGHTILVPAVWSLELANAILVCERKKRLNQPEIKTFTTLLQNLSITQAAQVVGNNVRSVLPLARAHSLSAYDAAYLELSIRDNAPLATLDRNLRKAAKASGVKLFEGEAAR